MQPGPRVLLATDLSARCDRALARALELTAADPDALRVVHIVEAPDDNAADEALRLAATRDYPELARPGRLVVAHGPVPATLARLAGELDCDLIVTGVARYNSLGDFFLGTAVDHLVRHSEVPVLVVKQRAAAPYRHLLVATDFSSCAREALIRSAALFPDAAVTAVHAYHVPYEAWLKSEGVREEMEREAERHMAELLSSLPDASLRGRVRTRLELGEPHEALCAALRETGADLLVLGTHGRGGFAHATIGSEAAALLASAASDVLMVREAGTSRS